MKLGIDIGGTSIPFGVVNDQNQIIYKDTIGTKSIESPELMLSLIFDKVKIFLSEQKLEGIGIGAPNGNFQEGTIDHAPNLPWKGVIPIKEIAENIFKTKVVVDNDANVAAIGELHFGKGQKYNDFVHLTLGTGLGAGIIINKKIFRGATQMAGELGHTIIEQNGRQCECGKKGCLETYASVTGLWKTAIKFITNNPSVNHCSEYDSPVTCSKKVYEEACKGNSNAIKIYEITGDKLALGIANVHYILGTEAFIFGGGLSKSGEFILNPVKNSLTKYTTDLFLKPLTIELTASNDGNIVLLGATALLDEN